MSDIDINGQEIKRKYFKVSHAGAFFIVTPNELSGQLNSIEDETDIYELSVIYMTKKKFEALPEFAGF